MKNIVLLCAAGMSTSMLVSKMQKAAADMGFESTIAAYALGDAPNVVPAADIVLLGPQVRFNQKKLQTAYPGKIVECIDMRDYGTMNGEAVIKFAKSKLGV